jgi:phospholipase C
MRRSGPRTKVLVAAAAAFLWAAVSGQAQTGTIQDVKHVVILMRENRAFDHYYGSLGGARGFNDRYILLLTNGSTNPTQLLAVRG